MTPFSIGIIIAHNKNKLTFTSHYAEEKWVRKAGYNLNDLTIIYSPKHQTEKQKTLRNERASDKTAI